MNMKTIHKLWGVIALLMMPLSVAAQSRTSQSYGTSGYWKLVDTKIFQPKDSKGSNLSEKFSASATEHTLNGLVGGYEFSFVSSIQAPPDRISADSLVLHTTLRRLSEDAPYCIWPSILLTFEDASGFASHGRYEGEVRNLIGTRGVGTRKEDGKYGEWDYVIYIPKGNKDEEQGLNFLSLESRTQWVYRWCEDTWAETPPPDEGDDDDEEEVIEPHVEVDTQAWKPDVTLPFAIPASVILGMLGYTLTKGKRKGKDGEDEMPEPREMHIYKDFGDTLIAGEEPKQVFAKIVRKKKDGSEVTDSAMTSLITITPGDQYMQVRDGGMYGEWRTAWVTAPNADNPPEEGIVDFFVGNDKGSYTNHVHFKVDAGKVLFGQDNLTLAAHYDKEVRLPFVVMGMAESATIEASIVDGAHNPSDFYSIHVEWNEEKEVHEAVIHDLKRDPKIDNGTPGNYIPFYLRVNVTNPSGSTIEGWISLVRYYMGLVFKIGDVKCFYEEQNPQKQKLPVIVGFTQQGKTYVPAETVGHLLLYEFDEEQHKVLIINPVPTAEKWGVKVIDESDNDALDAIGLFCEVPSNDSPKGTECILRCLKGGLKPPMRISAVITMGTEYNGRKYECEKQVLLCSQPYRTFQTAAEEAAAVQEDKAFLKKLDDLHNAIERQGLAGTLLPMLKYIERWQMGYDYHYGIDRSSMKHLGQLYNYMINNCYDYTYNVREPALPEEGFFWECTMALARGANEMNEKYGYYIMGFRVLVGFWTYGATEGAFKIYDLASTVGMTIALSEVYVDQGRDGLTKNLTYMAWDMAKMAIIMAAVNKGLNVGLGGLRAKYNPRTSTPVNPADIKPKTEPKPSEKQFTDTKRTRATKAATEQTARQQKAAENYLKSEEMKAKMEAIPDDHLHDAAYDYMINKTEQQLIDIRDFCQARKVYERYGMKPSKDFIEFERSFIVKCNENPMFKQVLKASKGDKWVEAKKIYNNVWHGENGINAEIDTTMKRILARDAQKQGIKIKASDIELDGVSGNSAADRASGKTIDMDRDTRYVYKDSNGNKIAFDEQRVRDLYNGVLYKKATGCKKLSQIQVDDFADKHLHTTIQDIVRNDEGLGIDVGPMMEGKFDQPLISPQKVQRTVIYKSNDPYSKAKYWYDKAKTIADPQERLQAEIRGICNEINGNYMTGKDGFRFVTALDDARADINGQKFVSQKLQTAFTICDQVEMKAAGNNMTIRQRLNAIDPRTVKKQLKTLGYDSYTDMTTDMDYTMGQILQHDYQEAAKWQMPYNP